MSDQKYVNKFLVTGAITIKHQRQLLDGLWHKFINVIESFIC